VILHLLCADHYESWSMRELENELATIELSAIEAALERLKEAGVVRVEDGQVRATEAAKRLEALDLIAV
jgi:methionine synthase II (cobalamin-independent)